MDARALVGTNGEESAARFLEARRYRIIERNYRCKEGEIDIVSVLGDVIVFCEVKTRSSEWWGQPSEAVDWRKQARLRRLAAIWMADRRPREQEVRFDVLSVIVRDGQTRITHIPEAF